MGFGKPWEDLWRLGRQGKIKLGEDKTEGRPKWGRQNWGKIKVGENLKVAKKWRSYFSKVTVAIAITFLGGSSGSDSDYKKK